MRDSAGFARLAHKLLNYSPWKCIWINCLSCGLFAHSITEPCLGRRGFGLHILQALPSRLTFFHQSSVTIWRRDEGAGKLRLIVIKIFHRGHYRHPFGSPTRHRVLNRTNSYRLACCSTGSVRGSSVCKRRFWPRTGRDRKYSASKGCAFFVTFFAQAKKVNELAKQCAIERFLRGGNITTDFTKEAAIYYLSYYAD